MAPRRTNEQQNSIDIAHIDERLTNLEGDIGRIHTAIESVQKDIKEINSASARVKGGIFVILIIGGIIGWLTTLGSTILKAWPFH